MRHTPVQVRFTDYTEEEVGNLIKKHGLSWNGCYVRWTSRAIIFVPTLEKYRWMTFFRSIKDVHSVVELFFKKLEKTSI